MQKLLIIVFILFSCKLFAQNNENLALKSLDFLNKKFSLNLEKVNDIVLIRVNESEEYICYKYYNKISPIDISRVKWRYEINELQDNYYAFTIKCSSEYNGTFKVIKSENDLEFDNLRYVIRTD